MRINKADAAALEQIRELLWRVDSIMDQADNAARNIKNERARNWGMLMVEYQDPELDLEDADDERKERRAHD